MDVVDWSYIFSGVILVATVRIFETKYVKRLDFYEGHDSRLILTLNTNKSQAEILKQILEENTTNLKATIKFD